MTDPPVPRTPVGRVVAASFVGTAIEWYDFFLYGTAAALVFPGCSSRPPTRWPFGSPMAESRS